MGACYNRRACHRAGRTPGRRGRTHSRSLNLRILHIYKNYAPIVGGIENHIKILAEAEAARGDEVTVLVTNTARHTAYEDHAGVRVIKAGREAELASTPFSLAMAIEAAELQPDVVNLHMPFPPGDLVARAVRGRPPLVVTYHSDIVRQQRLLQIYRPVLQRTLAHARRIIVTSQPYLDSSPFLPLYREKCRIVPYSVDAGRFGAVDEAEVMRLRAGWGAPVLLCVAVLRYYKGLHILLDALRDIAATLVIVGDGPEGPRLRALADELGIAGRVHFAGRTAHEDVAAYYQAADIFVLPSHLRSEAFGIVLLEAMAAGLPLVTTEIGTATSAVNQHGRTGFVVPPNNPRALARAIQALLADQRLREYLGQQGRRRAQTEFTEALMVERTTAVYREALGHDNSSLDPRASGSGSMDAGPR